VLILPVPKPELKIIKRLKQQGYTTYLVGGCVRDLLLGLAPKDYDIGTTATPKEVLALFPRRAFIIGRRFPIVHVYLDKNRYVEVSTFRGKEEYDGKIKENYGTPEEDALRRDLTINALFYDVFSKEIIDYVGGLEDLKAGIIRVIGDPDQRFLYDPVRMLRAIRHASRLKFNIETTTWEAILRNSHLIRKVAWERLRDEILKDLSGFWVADWFGLFKKSGILYQIYPFYLKMEKEKSVDERIVWSFLNRLSQDQSLSLEERICLFAYIFLPLINKPYRPLSFQPVPVFERKELLCLFFALFFTFRFNRRLFERSMDLLRDVYKGFYFSQKKQPFPKKLQKKPYFYQMVRLIEVLKQLLG